MCDPRMESTFNNRPPSVFSLILNPQNFTKRCRSKSRYVIALPLKTRAMYLAVCVYATIASFGRIPEVAGRVMLPSIAKN